MKKNRPSDRLQIQFILLSVLFLFAIALLLPCSLAEESRERIVSDAVSPMKIEIDTDELAAEKPKTKSVFLRNTGETETEYVCYIEQSGNRNDLAAAFSLSEKRIQIPPGESRELCITIPVEKMREKPAENITLKIIRNPETQTPVGYIIPIEIKTTAPNESRSAGKKTSAVLKFFEEKNAEPESEKKIPGNNSSDKTVHLEKKENSIGLEPPNPKKAAVWVFLMAICGAGGFLYLRKKRTEGKG